MFKRICFCMIVMLFCLSLSGCGNSDVGPQDGTKESKIETTEEVELLDLTGLWIQDGKKESETHMVATIREDGQIGVFFILEDDPEPWTYWVGTYDAPAEDVDKYSWTSQNTYGGNGLLASTAETKDFNYASETLSFEVTIQGETNTLNLIRGDWDEASVPESAFASVKVDTSDVKDLEIKESGCYVSGDYLNYYVVLHNPNDEIAVEFPSFRITARDADNVLLGTEDQTLSIIYPGQDFYYGFQAFSVDEVPTSVDFEMITPEDYNLKNASGLDEFTPLEVINTAVRDDNFVGEISNSNSYKIDSAIIVVICKDSSGNVTYVNSTFVDDIASEGTAPFSISYYGDVDTTNVEYYANQW